MPRCVRERAHKKVTRSSSRTFFSNIDSNYIADSPNVICFSDVRLFRFILYMYTNFADIPRIPEVTNIYLR